MLVSAGIDYSITCPAVCVHVGDEWNPENCRFLFIHEAKKLHGTFLDGKIVGIPRPVCDLYVQEHQERAIIVRDFLLEYGCMEVYLEGYSYSSTGKVFNLAENMGILKLILASSKIHVTELSPPEAKKFATGKGNANKEKMVDAFIEDYGVDLSVNEFPSKSIHAKVQTPINDLADAYFHCKLLHERKSK